MFRRWLRRTAAVAVLVGGLSFLGGPPAQAQSLCMAVWFWQPVGHQQSCFAYPYHR